MHNGSYVLSRKRIRKTRGKIMANGKGEEVGGLKTDYEELDVWGGKVSEEINCLINFQEA